MNRPRTFDILAVGMMVIPFIVALLVWADLLLDTSGVRSYTVNHLLDDTSADYEQFETELLSKDRDAANVDTLAALTRFGVEIGHLEGPLQLCARCSLGGLATYWTRDLEEHLVATPAE